MQEAWDTFGAACPDYMTRLNEMAQNKGRVQMDGVGRVVCWDDEQNCPGIEVKERPPQGKWDAHGED